MTKLLELIKDNPDLPIIPMVDAEIIGDDCGYWKGEWGNCEVTEYYAGRERIHFKGEEDIEDVVTDLFGTQYGCDAMGNDIYDLSEEEWDKIYQDIPWVKAIIVYITT